VAATWRVGGDKTDAGPLSFFFLLLSFFRRSAQSNGERLTDRTTLKKTKTKKEGKKNTNKKGARTRKTRRNE
jgi:hypothetical protein